MRVLDEGPLHARSKASQGWKLTLRAQTSKRVFESSFVQVYRSRVPPPPIGKRVSRQIEANRGFARILWCPAANRAMRFSAKLAPYRGKLWKVGIIRWYMWSTGMHAICGQPFHTPIDQLPSIHRSKLTSIFPPISIGSQPLYRTRDRMAIHFNV